MTDSQRGPWAVAAQPGNCRLCGGHWDPDARVRHDPDAGGLVDAVCGQDEEPEEVLGILDQLSQEDARP